MIRKQTNLVFLLVIPLAGCLGYNTRITAPPVEEPPKGGVVFLVGGVGGLDILGIAGQWALPRAGVRHEIREFAWTHGWGQLLKDLQDNRHLQKKASELAELVLEIKRADASRPVYLVGKSGGTGVVLAAAEQLPPATVERIVLLSAAVSPTYDLRVALRATKKQMISYYSKIDRFALGWGTSQFGSVDRVYGPCAGLTGFQLPENCTQEDRALYERLVQVPWTVSMILEGHWGSHASTSFPRFLGNHVAPWLKE